MLNHKTTGVIVLTIAAFAMPGNVFAQVSSQTELNLQLVQSQTVKSAEAAPKATPLLISTPKMTRRVKRVVFNPVPAQASAEQLKKQYVVEGVINAANTGKTKPTRFIYSRVKDNSQARVLFNASSLNSR